MREMRAELDTERAGNAKEKQGTRPKEETVTDINLYPHNPHFPPNIITISETRRIDTQRNILVLGTYLPSQGHGANATAAHTGLACSVAPATIAGDDGGITIPAYPA